MQLILYCFEHEKHAITKHYTNNIFSLQIELLILCNVVTIVIVIVYYSSIYT